MQAIQKRILLSILLIAIALVAVLLALSAMQPPATEPTQSLIMTVDPTIQANLTQMPDATPLSDEDAQIYRDLQASVDACDDYSTERRSQMTQHITWLIDPSDIPADVLLAFGQNPQSTLVFGMAGFTSTQWRLLERPADSCLIAIGRDLNTLLIANDREPFTIYDE